MYDLWLAIELCVVLVYGHFIDFEKYKVPGEQIELQLF